jgi:uncharacterized protein (TIGR02246 family)
MPMPTRTVRAGIPAELVVRQLGYANKPCRRRALRRRTRQECLVRPSVIGEEYSDIATLTRRSCVANSVHINMFSPLQSEVETVKHSTRIFAIMSSSTVLAACATQQRSTATTESSGDITRSQSDAETSVIRLERDWNNAWRRGDAAPMGQLLADDYTGINGNGDTETKTEFISRVRSVSSLVDSVTTQNERARVLGPDAAVVNRQLEIFFHDSSGIHTAQRVRATDTFANRSGRWLLVAHQVTPLQDSTSENDASANGRTTAPSPPTVSISQRRAMEDSANAFISRATQLVLHPDSAGVMALYPNSGPITYVDMGHITTSREEQEGMVGRSAHETHPTDVKIETTKVDVLAADAVAVTISFSGTSMDPKTQKRSTPKGAYTAVLALRDGKMRALQQHQSFQDPQTK